jgi:sec-independent protein translocase protein TatA
MVSLLALPEGGEWIVILVIVVLLFGAKRLPELTRNAARAMNEFKKANGGEDDDKPEVEAKPVDAEPVDAEPADVEARRSEAAGEEPRGV